MTVHSPTFTVNEPFVFFVGKPLDHKPPQINSDIGMYCACIDEQSGLGDPVQNDRYYKTVRL